MLVWARTHRRSAAICAATVLLPLLGYCTLMLDVWRLRAAYQDDIERLQPRIARMQGVQAFEQQLGGSAATVQRQVAELVYPASIDAASAGAALQKDVRRLLTDAGLTVSNSQLLPLREEEQFDYLTLKLTVAGGLPAFDDALAALDTFSPQLTVAALDVWPTRQRSRKGNAPVQEVTASLELVALRALL